MSYIDEFFQLHEKKLKYYTEKYKNKYNHYLTEEDIYQTAALGLAKAYYNNSKNISKTINDEIMHEILQHGYSSKVSPKVFSQYFKLLDEQHEMKTQQYSTKDIYLNFVSKFSYFDSWLGHFLAEANYYFSDPINVENCHYDDYITHEVYLSQLRDEFNRIFYEYNILSNEEIVVLKSLYGFDGNGEKTQREIAELLDIPDHRIRIIESNALRALRNHNNISALLEYMKFWRTK